MKKRSATLCILLLLSTGFHNSVAASCNVKPSASSFFKFMKSKKAEAKEAGETLLKASASTNECQPSFELKVLDSRGRVVTRIYDADTFELIAEDKPSFASGGSSDRSHSGSSGGSGNGGNGSGGSSGGSSDRDDDDDDDNDDDNDSDDD
ncbi:hypothetical protein [Vibrio nigripulchritudo]|uniref:hypothetical protein n=1 Tax=Vibrio nigripulchritudo TaxID=28173 RepID=UPI0005F9E92D|nr:hypothetical protein [Vibrio nigripulchritudo]KJY80005.1 hypothetical protein TW74_06515 [Vibrio nigripulchritudo]